MGTEYTDRRGKTTDWMVHMIGQSAGAYTDATHGITLSAVSMAYYRYICPYGLAKFRRYAVNVRDVNPMNKTGRVFTCQQMYEAVRGKNMLIKKNQPMTDSS